MDEAAFVTFTPWNPGLCHPSSPSVSTPFLIVKIQAESILEQGPIVVCFCWCYNIPSMWMSLYQLCMNNVFQAQAGWLQHDLGHLSVFGKSRWNHWVHKFVIGHLKVSSNAGMAPWHFVGWINSGAPLDWDIAGSSVYSRIWGFLMRSLLSVTFYRVHQPAGGIIGISSTMPNPIVSARTRISICTRCFLHWERSFLWRWVL